MAALWRPASALSGSTWGPALNSGSGSPRREESGSRPFASMEAGMDEISERRPAVDADPGRELRPGGVMPTLVVATIVIAGLYFARPVLQPFAMAVLLALLLAPAVRWLHQHRFGRVPSVAVTVFVAFLVIVGFAAAVGEGAISLAQKLPQYEG